MTKISDEKRFISNAIIQPNKMNTEPSLKPAPIDLKTPLKRDKIDLYKVREFADFTGMPYRLVLAAIASGELRCLRGNSRYFRIRSVDGAQWIGSLTKHIPT